MAKIKAKSYNKFDIFIFVLIISLAFGGFGGMYRIHRVLSVLLLPELFLCYPKCEEKTKSYLFFFLFLSVYSLISTLWVSNISEAFKYYFAYSLFDFLIFFEIIVFSYFSKDVVRSISNGWTMAIFLTLIVAYWEITTDNHLSLAKQEGEMMTAFMELRRFACVTFFNYNNYVTFLCFALPFVFYQLIKNDHRRVDIYVYASIIIASFICILYNLSRGGVISVLIMTFVYLLMTRQNKKNVLRNLSILCIAIIALLSLNDIVFNNVIDKFQNRGIYEDYSRFSIWEDALKLFMSTHGFGVGIGGANEAMAKVSHTGYYATHNMLIEFLLNFGIVFVVVYLCFLFKLLFKTMSLKDVPRKATVYMTFAAMPIYTIINSTYLNNAYVFASLASIIVYVYNNKQVKFLRKAV